MPTTFCEPRFNWAPCCTQLGPKWNKEKYFMDCCWCLILKMNSLYGITTHNSFWFHNKWRMSKGFPYLQNTYIMLTKILGDEKNNHSIEGRPACLWYQIQGHNLSTKFLCLTSDVHHPSFLTKVSETALLEGINLPKLGFLPTFTHSFVFRSCSKPNCICQNLNM